MILRASSALLACVIAAPAFAQANIEKVNGGIRVDAGQTAGTLETVNGSINIEAGATTRDAETVNGSIKVGAKARTGGLETVNGSIRVEDAVQIGGGVETVNGSVFIGRAGRIQGGVETVNGAIGLVDVDVFGGIDTVNGDVTVGAGSHVRGGIRYEKSQSWINYTPKGGNRKKTEPRVVIGPNAVVDGPLVFERKVELYVHSTARTGAITGATAVRYSTERAPTK